MARRVLIALCSSISRDLRSKNWSYNYIFCLISEVSQFKSSSGIIVAIWRNQRRDCIDFLILCHFSQQVGSSSLIGSSKIGFYLSIEIHKGSWNIQLFYIDTKNTTTNNRRYLVPATTQPIYYILIEVSRSKSFEDMLTAYHSVCYYCYIVQVMISYDRLCYQH